MKDVDKGSTQWESGSGSITVVVSED